MKKNLLKGLIGLGVFTLFSLNANAEILDVENATSTGKTVTVGEVDAPVYSVDIEWSDMTYDWKYDKETGEYGFRANLGCEGEIQESGNNDLASLKESGLLYSDNICSELQTTDLIDGNTYYVKQKVGGEISVYDNSINGSVSAKVEFVPSEEYKWVVGKISDDYVLSLRTGKIEYNREMSDGYLPVDEYYDGRRLAGFFYLEVDNSIVPTNEIKSNDVIGTVTVTIIPN